MTFQNSQKCSGLLKCFFLYLKDSFVLQDSLPFLHDPAPDKQHSATVKPGRKPGRPRNNKQHGSSCNGESSLSPVQQQPQLSVCDHVEETQENQGEELYALTNERGLRTGQKRTAESDQETNDDASETKRLCCERLTQTTGSASTESPTTERDEADTSDRDGLRREERGEKLTEREQSLEDEEEIDVEGDDEDDHYQAKRESISILPPSPSSCRGDIEEDIDVIGGSSPVPDPVSISWSDSSEGEEGEGDEDVDVVGEKMDLVPLALLTSRKGELENTRLRCS